MADNLAQYLQKRFNASSAKGNDRDFVVNGLEAMPLDVWNALIDEVVERGYQFQDRESRGQKDLRQVNRGYFFKRDQGKKPIIGTLSIQYDEGDRTLIGAFVEH